MRQAMIRRLTLTAATILAMLAFASPAWAATFTVNTTSDHNDGTCNPPPFSCTLREAVGIANNNGETDTIDFASDVRGTITLGLPLTIASDFTITGTPSRPVTINGPGADALAVSGNDASRVFFVQNGADATINGLTIRNGAIRSGNDDGGGGINNEGELELNDSVVTDNKSLNSIDESPNAAGIRNTGALTLNRSTVSNNFAAVAGGISNEASGSLRVNQSSIRGNTAAAGRGGGIFNDGDTLSLDDSTVSGNDASDYGGGIYSNTNLTGLTTTIRNSTISGNTAGDRGGGGIYNVDGLTRIENSTITDNNTAAGEGSGVASSGDAATRTEVFSTIISANANNDDVESGSTNSFLSNGYNLIGGGDDTGAFNKAGDRIGITNPGLGPLQNNGGPTQTHAVLGASPALDKGTNANCPAADQRGVARPQRGTCDIGSFEAQTVTFTFTVNSTRDTGDNDTSDGVCFTDTGVEVDGQYAQECTLRAAVEQANATAGADTINFHAGTGGEFHPSRGGPITLNAASGGISIYDVGLTINGPGAGALAVSGNDASRVFIVQNGADAAINGLTIRNGKAPAEDASGGGISNLGALTLNRSTVTGNTASDDGGGILNLGALTLNNSTVSGNDADFQGGGISNESTLLLNRSTVSGNDAEYGGGVYSLTNLTGLATTIRNSTISGNTADTYGGGIRNGYGLTRIENSTVTKNTAPAASGSGVTSRSNTNTRTEVFSTIISANANNDDVESGSFDSDEGVESNSFDSDGFNLIGGGDATGAFTAANKDQVIGDASPGLGPLLRNNGSTQTHALLGTSPALDKGTNAGCPATDQRGVARPQRGTCDIGSFERLNAAPVAGNDSYNGVEDRTLNVLPARGVLRNDTDADGDTLTASRVSGPGKGTLTLKADGSLTYNPPKNFNGVVSFVYRASDGKGGAGNATVTISIRARPG